MDEKTLQPTLSYRQDPNGDDFPELEVNERALYQKIDWRIVPILFLTYFLQFLDKVIVNYANLMGIQKDLGVKGNDFSWMATAFFIGFGLAELPQGALVQRYPVTKVLSANVFLWGVILCCSAACVNFGGILACRIALGACEAVVGPAFIMITSTWYTKDQSTPRYGLRYCGLGTGQIVGGIVSFAAQRAPSALPFAGWRIMLVCVGAANVLVAALSLALLLFTAAAAAPFLSAAETAHVARRLAADRAGTGPKVFSRRGCLSALADAQTWPLALLVLLTTAPSGRRDDVPVRPDPRLRPHAAAVRSARSTRALRASVSVAATLLPAALLGAGLTSFLPGNGAGSLAGV